MAVDAELFHSRAIQPARKHSLIPVTNNEIRAYLCCGQNYLLRRFAVFEFAGCCASSTS